MRNILKVSFGDAASKIFSVATTLLLIRGLSVSDYANYTTFSGVSFLFSGLVGAGINMALVRFSVIHTSKERERPLVLYIFAMFFQLAVYAVMAGLCLLFPVQCTALLFGSQPALALPLKLGLLAGLGQLTIQFSRTLYQAEEKFSHYIGTIWLIQILIFFCLAGLWFLHYLSFLPVAVAFAVVQLVIGLWLLVNYLRNLEFTSLKYSSFEQRRGLRDFLIGSGWLIGYFLMLNLFSRMDVLMLLRFKGREELAVYGVAFQYYSLSLLFLGSIHAVLLPKFSKADMQEGERQMTFIKQWLRWSVWLALPIILFDVFGKPLFVWINGSAYEKSFLIFVVFSIGVWFSMMFSPLVNILISRGRYRFLFFLSVAALGFDVAGNLLLIPALGGMGAAMVIVLTQNILIQIPILWEGLRRP